MSQGMAEGGMLRVRRIIRHYVWAGNVWPHAGLQVPACYGYICHPGPKFTHDLRTILRQFSATCDNWRNHRTFTTIGRPILR